MSFINERPVKAVRKDHRCIGCGRAVSAGTAAVRWTGLVDGDFSSVIYHTDCRAAEIALNDLHDIRWPDEWNSLIDLDPEDHEWLLSEFPTVAERFGLPVEA